MAFRAVVSGGHGPETPGKRSPDGIKEFEFNYPTAELVSQYLQEYEDVSVLKVYDKNRDVPLSERTKRANLWDGDVYISIHFNAYGQTFNGSNGIETLIYNLDSSKARFDIAMKVHYQLIYMTGRRNRGLKARPKLIELKDTNMPAFLVECGFMTNKEEKGLMTQVSYQQKCARAIVNGVADHYKLKKKLSTPPPPISGKLHRVQVGAFKDLKNAENLVNELKKKGYKDAFITN